MAIDYGTLTEYLRRVASVTTTLSFAEIESILGTKLPPSARRYPAWWSNSVRNSYSRICVDAGFRAQARLSDERVDFYRGDSPKLIRHRSRWKSQEHLDALEAGFSGYLETFQTRRIFSGPSVYFYEQLIKLVRGAASLSDLRSSDRLTELTYAALTSWGMHRMGATVAAKLTDFPTFSVAVRELIQPAAELAHRRITELNQTDIRFVTEKLAVLVGRPGISASQAPLVANAKTLHFLLPDLVPPIDRRYTCRFFLWTECRCPSGWRRRPSRIRLRIPAPMSAGRQASEGSPSRHQQLVSLPGRSEGPRQCNRRLHADPFSAEEAWPAKAARTVILFKARQPG